MIDRSTSSDPHDVRSFPSIKRMLLPVFECSFRDFFEPRVIVEMCCNQNAFSNSIPRNFEALLTSIFVRLMCADSFRLTDLCRAFFDSTSYLLSTQAQELPWLFDSFLRASVSDCKTIKANILSSSFDLIKSTSIDSGFQFNSDVSVTFPSGPVTLFGNKVVGDGKDVTATFWSIIYRGGNSAWSCGLVPEKEAENKRALWERGCCIGQYHSGSDCALAQHDMPESSTITVYVDFISKTAMFFSEGVLTSTVDVPETEVSCIIHSFCHFLTAPFFVDW